MKPYRIAYLFALACIAISAMSCVTTRVTAPDGTVTETTAPDPAIWGTAIQAAAEVAEHEINYDK